MQQRGGHDPEVRAYLYNGSRAVSQGLDRLLPNGGSGATTPLQVRQGPQVQLAISMSSGKDAKALAHNQAPTGKGGRSAQADSVFVIAERHFVTECGS